MRPLTGMCNLEVRPFSVKRHIVQLVVNRPVRHNRAEKPYLWQNALRSKTEHVQLDSVA